MVVFSNAESAIFYLFSDEKGKEKVDRSVDTIVGNLTALETDWTTVDNKSRKTIVLSDKWLV